MRPARALLGVLLVLALAGCGGGGSGTKSSNQDKVVAARWANGLHTWGKGMTDVIDGISVLFSRPADVRGIQAGSPRVGALLAGYERTLATCSSRVHRLGAAPATLELARKEALHACISLERAAKLIRNGVREFQHGLGPDVLNSTSDPLSAGQDGVRRALLDTSQG
jgi:hypothetical protein